MPSDRPSDLSDEVKSDLQISHPSKWEEPPDDILHVILSYGVWFNLISISKKFYEVISNLPLINLILKDGRNVQCNQALYQELFLKKRYLYPRLGLPYMTIPSVKRDDSDTFKSLMHHFIDGKANEPFICKIMEDPGLSEFIKDSYPEESELRAYPSKARRIFQSVLGGIATFIVSILMAVTMFLVLPSFFCTAWSNNDHNSYPRLWGLGWLTSPLAIIYSTFQSAYIHYHSGKPLKITTILENSLLTSLDTSLEWCCKGASNSHINFANPWKELEKKYSVFPTLKDIQLQYRKKHPKPTIVTDENLENTKKCSKTTGLNRFMVSHSESKPITYAENVDNATYGSLFSSPREAEGFQQSLVKLGL